MLNWRALAFNSMWVLAVAFAFAVFSLATWVAAQRSVKIKQVLIEPGYQRIIWLSAVLFCFGLAGIAEETWRQIAWLGLAGMLGGMLAWLSSKSHR